MLTDLNANDPFLGYRHSNTKGRQIHQLIQDNIIRHIGPHFPTYIARGPLTTSDHIPILCQIPVNPIQVPTLPRPNFRQAKRKEFTEEIQQKYRYPSINDNPTLEDIDKYIDDWYYTIEMP